MKCTHCGAIIPDDMLRCPECGMEIQIVPDYNPLEEVLAQEVKGSIADATRQIRTDDVRKYHREGTREYNNSTRVLSQGELDEIRARRYEEMRRRRQAGRSTGSSGVRTRPDTGGMRQGSRQAGPMRQQQTARKKRLARKRRKRALMIVLFLIILAGALGFLYYQYSYDGLVRKGNKALQANEYSQAESYFNKAIAGNKKKAAAYTGLSKVYIAKKDVKGAEAVFTTAIGTEPSDLELYKAAIHFYVSTNQLSKVSVLLEDCEYDNVLKGVKEYVSKVPKFSLAEGKYSEVQQVSLSSDGTIYYTTDGSKPDTSSKKYDKPILVQNEGTTVIKAISVNKKKIPSLIASKSYEIELPMEDAPSVTPSTGQYESVNQITITVPEGYTAYYTMDNTDPTDPAVNATQYTGPIDMPKGQTMFSAVLKNNNTGKYTQVTKRNYVLDIQG